MHTRSLSVAYWLLGVCWLNFLAPPAQSETPVKIEEIAKANGWNVKVSFRNAPEAFARAAHVWTLERAKEVAQELHKTYSQGGQGDDLSVAEIRLEGKDGDGEINPDQGPHLPDWPLVERQFRASSGVKSADLDTKLAELKSDWVRAGEAVEEALRSRDQPLTTEKEKALRQHQESFNSKAEALDEAFFGEGSAPLPRLQMPNATDILEFAREWPATKRVQSDFEKTTQRSRQQESALSAFQKAMTELAGKDKKQSGQPSRDDRQGKNQKQSGTKPADNRSKTGGTDSKQDDFSKIERLVDQQLKGIDSLLVDSSRIAPRADGFAGDDVQAKYSSTPRIEIRKTDASGKSLPDGQQPAGYPKPFLGEVTAAAGEGVFVDPLLRVQLISKTPGKKPAVRAGVYGKVTAVDSKAGRVEVQVDTQGTRMQMSGFQPQGIRVGDYVEPSRPIGNFNSAPRSRQTFEVLIQMMNANNRLLFPGPVLEYARRKPIAPRELKRDVPEPNTRDLRVLGNTGGIIGGPLEDGKLYESKRLVSIESATAIASTEMVEARELIAKRDLEVAKERERLKVDEAGLLNANTRQVDSEVKAAREKIAAIEGDGARVLADAEKIEGRKQTLEKELDALKESKNRLDAMAARAKASNSDRDIDAFNAEAQRHNARFQKLQTDNSQWEREKSSLATKVAALQRDRKREQTQEAQLKAEAEGLKAKATTAQSEVEQARAEVKTKEEALAAIGKEKLRLEQAAAEKKSQTPGKESAKGRP